MNTPGNHSDLPHFRLSHLRDTVTAVRRVLQLVAALLLPMFASTAHAARVIDAVTLNNASSVTVTPGDYVTLVIDVTTTGSGAANDWRGTGWLISTTPPGTLTCWNHANFTSAGSYSANTTIQVPTTPGTYNVYFVAYDDDGCTTGASAMATLVGGVTVQSPALTINSVTLDGASSVTVGAGQSITAVVNATSNSSVAGYQWRSTGWRLSTSAPGVVTCVDHTNHDSAGTFTETFTINAPGQSGTYNAYFIAYNDNACGVSPSQTATLNNAVTIPSLTEFNSTGGNTATNGLHFYLEDTTKIQVRRLNNTGQVYAQGSIPPSNILDNGVFLRANGLVYGPSHTVGGGFAPSGGMYNNYSITPASPANPSTVGTQQTATGTFGVTGGPQVSVLWKYTTPLDFLTAEVTLVIPTGYAVSAANPVRYYHVFDTYLGGSDNGCGFSVKDATTNNKRFVGTYQPTSGVCTTTTGIPSGINVVESFRERDTLEFSAYCASGWASFFNNGSTNCSVLQSADMSNALQASFADTGIGIQYNFTATGTYRFSYDFVIGSPNVPPYDHLEIQHDGAGTLCPETVTVLACTSSTVPCPALDRVNTGTLTGTLTVSPTSPATTITPNPFTLGASGSTQTLSLQASGAGSFTLGTSGLSTTPLNGTKCWNTASSTASCAFSVANTPCVGGYECLETGATYNNLTTTPSARNPLYTKLSGTPFTVDVIALQSSGAVASSYTASGNVTVDFFDDSASPTPACSAYSSPIASQAVTFVAGDSGRKTLSAITLSKAYSKVRCRVRDTNISPTINGCSSDTFSVRPQQFTVSSGTANADSAGTNVSATPTVKASGSFGLTADTSTVGYGGTPSLDASKVEAHTGAIQTGALTGTFGAANSSTGNGATNTNFAYSEVGYFRLKADGVVDSTFTLVDSANSDCVVGSSSNTLSAAGKYGCNVGSTVSPYFGRFIPDHFDTVVSHACSPSFTYSGQPFPVTVKAMNGAASPAITRNFDGTAGAVFSKATTLSPVASAGGAAIVAATGALSSGSAVARLFRSGSTDIAGTVSVTNGSATVTGTGTVFSSQLAALDVVCIGSRCYSISAVSSNTSLTLSSPYSDPLLLPAQIVTGQTMTLGQTFAFANRQTIPKGVFVRAAYFNPLFPAESVTSDRAAASMEGGTTVRSGRVRLSNAYGSEVLTNGLPVPVAIEFYDTAGAAGWRTGSDACTVITPRNFAYVFPVDTANMLAACETAGTSVGSNPNPNLALTSPGAGNRGWTDITLNLAATTSGNACIIDVSGNSVSAAATTANAPWLQYNWAGTVGNPTARATFGVYKSPLIYRRENF